MIMRSYYEETLHHRLKFKTNVELGFHYRPNSGDPFENFILVLLGLGLPRALYVCE